MRYSRCFTSSSLNLLFSRVFTLIGSIIISLLSITFRTATTFNLRFIYGLQSSSLGQHKMSLSFFFTLMVSLDLFKRLCVFYLNKRSSSQSRLICVIDRTKTFNPSILNTGFLLAHNLTALYLCIIISHFWIQIISRFNLIKMLKSHVLAVEILKWRTTA